MRFAVGVLICLNLGAVSLAVADPSAPSPAPATGAPAADAAAPAVAPATPPASAPAAAPATAAATSAAKSALDADEKHFISEGYKPEMRNGQKVFCRREQVLGSRLGEAKHCATIEQLKVSEQESKDVTEQVQRTQKNPQGY